MIKKLYHGSSKIIERPLYSYGYLGKLGLQFVLKSKTAFDRIQYIGSEVNLLQGRVCPS